MSSSTVQHSDNHHSTTPSGRRTPESDSSAQGVAGQAQAVQGAQSTASSHAGKTAPKSTEQDVPADRSTLRDRLDDGLDDTFPASDPISAGTLQKQAQEDQKSQA